MKESILKYLNQEKLLLEEELQLIESLPIEAKIEKGWIIPELSLILKDGTCLEFACEINNSKVKSGDKITLFCDAKKYPAEVIDNSMETITIKTDKSIKSQSETQFKIEVTKPILIDSVIAATEKLTEGAPGYFYLKTLFDVEKPEDTSRGSIKGSVAKLEIYNRSNSLNESQIQAIVRTLAKPSLLAIQGPPGTGKTHVLSITADIFAAHKQSVCILAPTHQAVNNSLNAIAELNPKANIFKIGALIKSEGLHENIKTMSASEFFNERRAKNIPRNAIVGMSFFAAIIHLGLRNIGFRPNVLLIDEAGQLPLTQGTIAGFFGSGSIILYGDDAQMPPIYTNGLEKDPFSVSLFSQIRNLHPTFINRLDTTYRMNQEICDYVGNRYYPNQEGDSFLKTAKPNQELNLSIPDDAPVWIKEALASTPAIYQVKNQSDPDTEQINIGEAKAIALLVKYAMLSGLSINDLAIVSPYRKQVIAIRSELTKLEIENTPIVDTVERVQGLTVQLIIISQPTTCPKALKRNHNFIFNPNRLNVAFSRAKSKVIHF